MAKKLKRLRSTLINEESRIGKSAVEALGEISFEFDCAVAVWLQDFQEMSPEILLFLELKAIDFECVSRCFKYRLRSKKIGVICVFGKEESAIQVYCAMTDMKSPHGDYPFRVQHLGSYLRTVAEIEDKAERPYETGCKVIFRNLRCLQKVVNRVLQLCAHFGPVTCEADFQEVSEKCKFRHLSVRYNHVVTALAAQLALDGKWIQQQDHPLSVEVIKDEEVRRICTELAKRNKLVFEP